MKLKGPRFMLQIAKEWADELGKFRGHEAIVAEIAAEAFGEVERGRNADVVLKEMLAKIEDRIAAAKAKSH